MDTRVHINFLTKHEIRQYINERVIELNKDGKVTTIAKYITACIEADMTKHRDVVTDTERMRRIWHQLINTDHIATEHKGWLRKNNITEQEWRDFACFVERSIENNG